MKFQLRPILSEIKELYLKPISNMRFKEYITKLQGDSKGDLALPISGFNPMAKEHIIQKIEELEYIESEAIMEKTIGKFNSTISNLTISKSTDDEIMVVLNLADDLKGGWTNFFSTDFDSKFKLNAFVSRKFCVPYFWTSETYNEKLIETRTQDYLNRTLYRLSNSTPKTLEEYFEQETFVSLNALNNENKITDSDFQEIAAYYNKNKNSEANDLIFNFFYGDEASENLGYKKYGVKNKTGYKYAKFIALNKK